MIFVIPFKSYHIPNAIIIHKVIWSTTHTSIDIPTRYECNTVWPQIFYLMIINTRCDQKISDIFKYRFDFWIFFCIKLVVELWFQCHGHIHPWFVTRYELFEQIWIVMKCRQHLLRYDYNSAFKYLTLLTMTMDSIYFIKWCK